MREIASAIVLRLVGMNREVTRKLYLADSQKIVRSHCITLGSREVPLLMALSVVVLSVRTVIHFPLRHVFQRSSAANTVKVSSKLMCACARRGPVEVEPVAPKERPSADRAGVSGKLNRGDWFRVHEKGFPVEH